MNSFPSAEEIQGVFCSNLQRKTKGSGIRCGRLGLLDDDDIARIRAFPEVSELSTFLKKLQKDDKAAFES